MTSIQSKSEIQRLRDAALADLEATSDEQLLLELKADGINAEQQTSAIKAAMQASIAAALRTKLVVARSAALASAVKREKPTQRPSLERLKEMVLGALRSNPNVGLAFRDGTRQTDTDFISLYDDLIETGVIEKGDDGV
jgi:hypothetical protein